MLIEAGGAAGDAIAVHGVTRATLPAVLASPPRVAAGFAAARRYKGEPGEVFLAPGEAGALAAGAWAHFDVYGWTPAAKPGRPEGGEVRMAHCLFSLLAARNGAVS